MSPKYFAVTPQVLEAVNGEVPVTISGTFPEKFFPKKAVITATPVLKWEGGSVNGETYTLFYKFTKQKSVFEKIRYRLSHLLSISNFLILCFNLFVL